MNKLSVERIDSECIQFNDGTKLFSDHEQECCESHYLDFSALSLSDFDGLLFDLSGASFFERLPDYGIALLPINGFPVRIAGYGINNGYYSSDMALCVKNDITGFANKFVISDCQQIGDGL